MVSCPHCSTYMEDYATVCPGCGAEKILVAEEGKFSIVAGLVLGLTMLALLTFLAAWLEMTWIFYGGIVFSIIGFKAGGEGFRDEAQYEWHR
jgi:hypothetical protein